MELLNDFEESRLTWINNLTYRLLAGANGSACLNLGSDELKPKSTLGRVRHRCMRLESKCSNWTVCRMLDSKYIPTIVFQNGSFQFRPRSKNSAWSEAHQRTQRIVQWSRAWCLYLARFGPLNWHFPTGQKWDFGCFLSEKHSAENSSSMQEVHSTVASLNEKRNPTRRVAFPKHPTCAAAGNPVFIWAVWYFLSHLRRRPSRTEHLTSKRNRLNRNSISRFQQSHAQRTKISGMLYFTNRLETRDWWVTTIRRIEFNPALRLPMVLRLIATRRTLPQREAVRPSIGGITYAATDRHP